MKTPEQLLSEEEAGWELSAPFGVSRARAKVSPAWVWRAPLPAWFQPPSPVCPGRKGGDRLLERSPGFSRRLATEAGFLEAALFFKKKKQVIFYSTPLSGCVGGWLLPRGKVGGCVARWSLAGKPRARAAWRGGLQVLRRSQGRGGRNWEAAAGLQ